MSGETPTSCNKRSESAGWPNMGPVRLFSSASSNVIKVFGDSELYRCWIGGFICTDFGRILCNVLRRKIFLSTDPF